MKKLLIISCLLMTCQFVSAQDFPLFDVGLKAGANGSFIRNVTSGFDGDGMKIGFVGGAWGRVKIPAIGLYVQPELVFSQTGGRLKGDLPDIFGNPLEFTQRINLNNLDVVILLGKRFGLGSAALRINLGPVFGTVLSAKSKTETAGVEDDLDIKEVVNSSQIGLQVGVGVDFSKLNIDLRFQQNFTKLYDQNLTDDDTRISALQLTLGYKIF